MQGTIQFLQNEPIFSFAVLLGVILIFPIIFEKLKLPGLIGLLLAGVLLGKNGLHLLDPNSEMMKLFSDIGVVYLMFAAGLEIDVEEFRKIQDRSLTFGMLTFSIPLIVGTIIGRIFGYGWNPAILIGSLFASHTPLGYPIISRMGLMSNEAVIITIGGTIFTNIPSLLVLAVCVAINAGEFNILNLVILLGGLVIYSLVILFGLEWVGREFFRRSGDEQGTQFLFVLLALFLSAVGAQIIGVEKIVGAFLAGLAVSKLVGQGPVKEKVEFVGTVLFIPMFLVNLGLRIDLPAFVDSLSSIWLTLAVVIGLMVSKFVAAWLTKLLYRYSWAEMMVIWSLSVPQVAATLAATLVGYRVGLLKEDVLNSVIVLMLVTATVGPLVTARSAVRLAVPEPNLQAGAATFEDFAAAVEGTERPTDKQFTVVVPVYNPETEQYLVELAALLARHEGGRMVPLAIAKIQAQMPPEEMETVLVESERRVAAAVQLSQNLGVNAEPLIRVDSDVALGICHASREQRANSIVMGWGETSSLRARLFGNVIDTVLWSSHCPVAVARLLDSPTNIRRIMVALDNWSEASLLRLRFARIFAEVNQAPVMVLYLCNPGMPAEAREQVNSLLVALVAEWEPRGAWQVQMQVAVGEEAVAAVVNTAASCDLAILRSPERSTIVGLKFEDFTTAVLPLLRCSVVMLGEPG
ncbi:MAG TPA: cation:proton antiporter [Oscillatoriaceae cyanobacterium M33_DOE_052]|uniref:Sodium:proton antiporter n=1 Tax=Planktothricoides sp. SpSt-374 TaxID=2282167 RepID=A0A7C3VQW6_9CYAN|nr:cation:proton antiporter [Oscillatoriaceae cyanobacterium M33_DOE_052]